METDVTFTGMEVEVSRFAVETGLGGAVIVGEGGATGTVFVAGSVACRGGFMATVCPSVSVGAGVVPGFILRSELPNRASPIRSTSPIPP